MHPADEFLMHYGVAGMKWGKRRARTPDEKAAGRAKAIKIAKVAGTVAVVAVVAAGAIYAGKQMNARAGQRAIADFDNSDLRKIVDSGKLFGKASTAATVKLADLPTPKPPRQLLKKAATGLANKAKPHAGKVAEMAKPHAQQFVINKVQERLARNAQKVKDLEDAEAENVAIAERVLRNRSR